ncbi:response regulator [Bdellovibrionota bacterium FG-1]
MTDESPAPSVATPSALPPLAPSDQFIKTMIRSTILLLREGAGVEATAGKPGHRKLDGLPPAEVSVVAQFGGKAAKGLAVFSFKNEIFKQIFWKLTQKVDYDPASGPPEGLTRWAQDLMTLVASEMKSQELVVEPAFPVYFSGVSMNPTLLSSQAVIAIPFTTPHGVFHGEFSFFAPQVCELSLPSDIRILVADDSALIRKSVVRFLNAMGLNDIIEATNGEAAWLGIQGAINMNKPFDLLLSDWNMPKMSGLELLKQVRGFDKSKAMRVIIFTTEQDGDHVRAAIAAGVNAYLVKPVTQDSLAKKIEALWTTAKKPQ